MSFLNNTDLEQRLRHLLMIGILLVKEEIMIFYSISIHICFSFSSTQTGNKMETWSVTAVIQSTKPASD